MEGDGPTGCMVIPQYVELRTSLDKKIEPLSTTDAIYPMLAKMREKTNEYMNEALQCETLVMATLLHPFFRLKFFAKHFGESSAVTINAEATLRRIHREYEMDNPATDESRPKQRTNNSQTPVTSSPRPFIFCEDSDVEAETEEPEDVQIKNYLNKVDRMKTDEYDIQDPTAGLEWWSKHKKSYRVLALMAKDYLACTGSSCASKRIFSCASDVCSSSRGALLARTIERLVSSRLWLREGVELGEDYEDLAQVLKTLGIVID